MVTSRKLSTFGMALCIAAAGVTAPALARHAAAAPVAPRVAVVGHVSITYVNAPTPRSIQWRRLILRITGSNFKPGRKVGIAVINTFRWEVLAKGSTYAQRATTRVVCGHDFELCSRPNPRAGTFDYRVRLSYAPAASNLLVLYRTAGDAGMQAVTLR